MAFQFKKKSFFKAVYAKHTNFGMQKFRLNYDKERELSFLSETEFTFKVSRFGDLLFDTFICCCFVLFLFGLLCLFFFLVGCHS